jgi:PIN domain nuclease of toxin-antitoxin system
VSRYLLDTHVWLWMQTDPARLGTSRALIENRANELLLSAASVWEIAIKSRIGRLNLPEPAATYIPDRMRRSGTTALAIEVAHTLRTAELPDLHRDPFDRLLVAQAQVLGLPLITADHQIAAYEVEVVAI